MAEISIAGLNKGAVLAALYNASKPLGVSYLQYTPRPMSVKDGERIITMCEASGFYIDYLKGRSMKVDLGKDSFDSYLYDRDNGLGAAERAVSELRK